MAKNQILVVSDSSNISLVQELCFKTSGNFLEFTMNQVALTRWLVETRYFVAETELLFLIHDQSQDSIHIEDFSRVDAFILFNQHSSPLSSLDQFKDIDASVLIIASKQDDQSLIDWCVGNGFEYLDLNEESVDGEKVGVDRMIEALEGNAWPTMQSIDNAQLGQFRQDLFDQDDFIDRIREIRNSAATLSLEERREVAAKVALAFLDFDE